MDGPHTGETEPCRLLELPAELRNQIFELAVRQPDGIVFRISMSSTSCDNNHMFALASTCKQTKSEVGNSLFELNTATILTPVIDVINAYDSSVPLDLNEAPDFQVVQIAGRFDTILQHLHETGGCRQINVWLGKLRQSEHTVIGLSRTIGALRPIFRAHCRIGTKIQPSLTIEEFGGIAAHNFGFHSEEVEMACLVPSSAAQRRQLLKRVLMMLT